MKGIVPRTVLPASEIAVDEDEIDIHLNPKIGQNWVLRALQKLRISNEREGRDRRSDPSDV